MQTRQTVLILTLFFLMGLFVARLPATVAQLSGGGSYDFFDPIIDVYSVIDRAYVDEPDRAKLQAGAIKGMLEALGDPYTEFVPPADRALFQKEITGQFVGIGAEVVTEGGYLTIVSPLEDSPAIAAGIRAGDKVVEVNGTSTLNKSVDECIDLLTGEPGTQVNVVIERHAGAEKLNLTIIRQHIIPRAVRGVHRHRAPNGTSGDKAPVWDYMLDPERKIAYIRLTQFTPTAAEELAGALKEIHADQPGAVGGLILDLRGDPGGVLEGALAIADLFLKEGVIVSVKGRAGGSAASAGVRDEVYTAKEPGTLPDFPMIVLVNGASASASEIVAGALSDHGRAVVVGTRSFGKGLVQAVQTMRRPVYGGAVGAQIKFTSQRYYLPSGRLLHRTDDATTWGVDPTPGFYVPMTSEEQIARILERRARDVLVVDDAVKSGTPAAGGDEPRWGDPEWLETSLKDKQLAAAVRAVGERLASGEWKPVSTEVASQEQPGKITATELRNLELGRERILRELTRVERRIGTLESTLAGDETPAERAFDLWPDDKAVSGGHLQVFDKDGKLVATLNITGENLERWLIDAGVEPAEQQAGGKAEQPATEPASKP